MDWCATRVNALTPLRDEFVEILDEVRSHPKEFGFRADEHYAVSGSLEPFGLPMRFFGWNKHKNEKYGQSHKLEMTETGNLSVFQIHACLERVVNIDPDELEVMRTDLCADLPDVTVEDVNNRMRVKFKRRGSRMTEYLEIWNGDGDTRYHGGRPNCYRVYNKTAQLQSKYKGDVRKLRKTGVPDYEMKAERFDKENPVMAEAGRLSAGLEPDRAKQITDQFKRNLAEMRRAAAPVVEVPSFFAAYGVEKETVLTRVERQMGTNVPNALSTFGKLRKNLVDFDPFTAVDILKHTPILPSRTDYTFAQYECGLHLRRIMEEHGRDYTQNYIKIHNPGNGARAIEIYTPFLEAAACERVVTREYMTEVYRNSASLQLAA